MKYRIGIIDAILSALPNPQIGPFAYQGMRPVTHKNLGKRYKSRSVYHPHQGYREKFRNKCRYATSGAIITDTDIVNCSDFHEIWMKNWEVADNANYYQRV